MFVMMDSSIVMMEPGKLVFQTFRGYVLVLFLFLLHSIDITKMCDGRFDCVDKSDEFNCTNFIIKSGFHDHLKSNPPLPDKKEAEKLKMVIDLIMYDININEVSSTLSAKFKIKLAWTEPRVDFIILKQDEKSNHLTEQEMEEIWMPKLMFRYTKDVKILDYELPYARVKMNNGSIPIKSTMDNLWNGYTYAGKDW